MAGSLSSVRFVDAEALGIRDETRGRRPRDLAEGAHRRRPYGYFFLAGAFSAFVPAQGASSITPSSSCSSRRRNSFPPSFTAVPANEPKSTRSPGLTLIGTRL